MEQASHGVNIQKKRKKRKKHHLRLNKGSLYQWKLKVYECRLHKGRNLCWLHTLTNQVPKYFWHKSGPAPSVVVCPPIPEPNPRLGPHLLATGSTGEGGSESRLWTIWTVAYQAPPSMGFSRQEYQSELPFPSLGDLPDPGTEPRSPALQADALPSEPPGKPWENRQYNWFPLQH